MAIRVYACQALLTSLPVKKCCLAHAIGRILEEGLSPKLRWCRGNLGILYSLVLVLRGCPFR